MAHLELELDEARKVIEMQGMLSAPLGARSRERAWRGQASMVVDSASVELAKSVRSKHDCRAVGPGVASGN